MPATTRPRAILPTLALALAAMLPPAFGARSADATVADGFTEHLAGLINSYRAEHGLSPLTLNDDLAVLAGEHSTSMAQRRQLTHEGFQARFRRSTSKMCVENLAWNFPTPESLLEGWQNSPEHLRNLLEPKVSRMGLAASTRFVTFFACR